ncbi:Mpp10p [Sugiyamaella lignohabitans]|uniref:U3 small nucleolar ribonucleoprotein protein MPP10 n=1 Tax=Sugiyamaella lignohabitans TaxID=796027 RepID=A0A167CM85_9ASCO|nr:Mpp10p [Sugiyamaella lignohabitans]ANB11880.1 Mpp10p [Sugiyamaella lignohabitans]
MSAGLVELLNRSPQNLLVPSDDLKAAAFKAVKESLDPIASDYSIFDQLHTEGLDAEQIWAQARMVVDGAIEKLLGDVMSRKRKREDDGMSDEELDSELDEDIEQSGDEESDEGFADIRERQDLEDDEDSDLDVKELDGYEEVDEDEEEEEDDDEQTLVGEDGFSGDEDGSEEENEEDKDENVLSKPKSELDEGLFRLADFQQQILALEKDDQEDEEEDINYFADAKDQDSESDADMQYDDFFAPAPKILTGSADQEEDEEDEESDYDEDEEFTGLDTEAGSKDIDSAMKNARRELFADDDEEEEEGGPSTEKLSTFEKQQLEIMKQIKQLEEENVAEKSWAVRGEVKAKDRPLDSLIETDLDFERNAKPVPVITQEVTESLEDMIRRRIKNEQFDDIPRRLPDTLPEFQKAKLVEVQETKSQKSLAELYEDDYVKEHNPDSYKDAESEQLKGAHKEIEDMYTSLSRKLDALCSWNYTPKAPKAAISIVSNVAAISMEEAQPLAMATESMLAPQEVYQPGATSKREVVGANGLPVAKAEMSREERKREKRHQKAKRAKHFKEKEAKENSKAQKEGSKSNIMDTLKKGNVTVIGKKGEKRDLSGKLVKEKGKVESANLKL